MSVLSSPTSDERLSAMIGLNLKQIKCIDDGYVAFLPFWLSDMFKDIVRANHFQGVIVLARGVFMLHMSSTSTLPLREPCRLFVKNLGFLCKLP